MTRRGAYAKGVAKREEILEVALGVVAEVGYGKASVRAIADAAELSPAGLLHYFGSKEELFVAVLAARDARDSRENDGSDFAQAFLAVIRHNASVPGLVRLYARLAADAGDPQHPANGFFRERTARLEGIARLAVVQAQEAGDIRPDVAPEWVMRVLHATADGLQTAWMLDHSIDMAADLEELLRVLRPA
jgi:AcrR family transcriptional regulator